ncbi:spore germination protein [Cohnella sp.]|uniref:spore germination protein n=1 Tax=Cohnella sp. TaxID=1883426 RepID=UPI003568AF26
MSDQKSVLIKLGSGIDANINTLLRYREELPDLVVKRFCRGQEEFVISYLSSITDSDAINDRILAPLLNPQTSLNEIEPKIWLGTIQTDEWEVLIKEWANGFLSVIYDGEAAANMYDVKKYPKRQPDEPLAETAIQGNHVGFIESFEDNLAMIRYFLNDGRLVCRAITIGTRVKTTCGILFLKDVTNEEWVNEMARRVENINIDAVINIGILEEWVEDTSFSIFPQFFVTERPDVTVSHLLQGRIALLLDKTSGAIVGPSSFGSFFQSIDDYVLRWPVASFIRILRIVGFLVAVFLPSAYIATLTYHYEIIPIDLLMSIGRSREKVPFHRSLRRLSWKSSLRCYARPVSACQAK